MIDGYRDSEIDPNPHPNEIESEPLDHADAAAYNLLNDAYSLVSTGASPVENLGAGGGDRSENVSRPIPPRLPVPGQESGAALLQQLIDTTPESVRRRIEHAILDEDGNVSPERMRSDASRRALRELGQWSAPFLLRYVDSSNDDAPVAARATLLELGPDALPASISFLRDQTLDPMVRHHVEQMRAKIMDNPPVMVRDAQGRIVFVRGPRESGRDAIADYDLGGNLIRVTATFGDRREVFERLPDGNFQRQGHPGSVSRVQLTSGGLSFQFGSSTVNWHQSAKRTGTDTWSVSAGGQTTMSGFETGVMISEGTGPSAVSMRVAPVGRNYAR